MNERILEMEAPRPVIEIEPGYEGYIPQEFQQDPLVYFETHGKNIKQGETEYHPDGSVREDPTAVKDLPAWKNEGGEELHTVGKRVNVSKGMIGKTQDPFYEFSIMEMIQQKKLPGARPIAKISQGDTHLIIMERVPGLRWSYRHELKKHQFTDADVNRLHIKAEALMTDLQRQFEAHGILRDWKLSDMVFDIDVENKDIRSLTPVDWERTRLETRE